MAKYIINCYMYIDVEKPEIYDTINEANKTLESLQLMQPENIYKIEKVIK